MIMDKPPIEKLHSFFITKEQFEFEIASSGLLFNDELKKVFKLLDKKGEIDKSVINNYNFMCCEQYFKREVKYLLEDIELDIFRKTDAIAPNDLKCDYITRKINQLISLAKITDSLKGEYSKLNLDDIRMKEELLSKHINLNYESTIHIRSLYDLIYDIFSINKMIKSKSVPNDDLFKIFDFSHSNIYVTCLIQITNEIISVIGRIVEGSEYILDSKFNVIKEPPYLIPREQQKVINETPKTFEELFYNIDFVNPCIDILKELKSPFIDTDYNYIGKLKGVYCIWIEELTKQGIIKSYSERKIYASLIPTKIKGFSIDESMFGKIPIRAENYRIDIKSKISIIKLSQVSQKEN
jgi:hypothetical protein